MAIVIINKSMHRVVPLRKVTLWARVVFAFNGVNSNKSFYRRLLPPQLVALNSH